MDNGMLEEGLPPEQGFALHGSANKKLFIANLRSQPVEVRWQGCEAGCRHLSYQGDEHGGIIEEQLRGESRTKLIPR